MLVVFVVVVIIVSFHAGKVAGLEKEWKGGGGGGGKDEEENEVEQAEKG